MENAGEALKGGLIIAFGFAVFCDESGESVTKR
jgi:hypothetical protein